MDKKEKRISVRVDEKVMNKLAEIMAARGLNQSEAICHSILEIPILRIGNVECLGDEFCKIRKALEYSEVDEELKKEVNQLCQYMLDLLLKVEA